MDIASISATSLQARQSQTGTPSERAMAALDQARQAVQDGLGGMRPSDALQVMEASRQLKIAAQNRMTEFARMQRASPTADVTLQHARQRAVEVALMLATAGMVDASVYHKLGIPPLVVPDTASLGLNNAAGFACSPTADAQPANEMDRTRRMLDFCVDNQLGVVYLNHDESGGTFRVTQRVAGFAYHYGLMQGTAAK